jgi:beta-lactamase superfamily II metal-dependent hydrolase
VPELTFVFMDSGQGDCTLIVYPDGSLTLVDCGTIKNSDVVAPQIKLVLARYLPNTENKNTINNFVLTHPDQDHYNMIKHVLKGTGAPVVKQVYFGGARTLYKNGNESDATYDWLKAHPNCAPPPYIFQGKTPDVNLSRAGVQVYLLAANATGRPDAADGHSCNTNSIVLLFIYNGVKTFLMGDASEATEGFIMDQVIGNKLHDLLDNTKFTMLKMGHHGSDTSSSEIWIRAIQPNGLFISSDTKGFGKYGTGMPTFTHLTNVVSWSGKIKNLPKDFCHSTIYYADQATDKKFVASPLTRQAVCTTLYQINYNTNGTDFEATGGSWFARVPDSGPDTVLIDWTGPHHGNC